MHKTCGELFGGLDCTVIGDESSEIKGLAYRSDKVKDGFAFFCIVGNVVDGHTFAQDAIDRGASVLVAERSLLLADSTNVTVVIVPDSRKAMAYAANRFYDEPSESFDLVGVTGTNGKTTTTYLVESIAENLGYKTGIVGTTGIKIGSITEPAEHTTPESPDLEKVFAQMRDAGCQVVAMEVSSHALDLYRVYANRFSVTAFTNLTQDHLDYHKTFEEYFEAKAKLFSAEYPAKRVISINDSWGQRLNEKCEEQGDYIITTGFSEEADIHPIDIGYASDKTHMTLFVRGYAEDGIEIDYPLAGRFNVENVMTAVGICLGLGFGISDIAKVLEGAHTAPGRLERVSVPGSKDIDVYVDYAHTPDALTKALSVVSDLSRKRTITVFGCGGDRDKTKRPLMGQAALESDIAIVTSDNPRTEDASAIIDDIVAGMDAGIRVEVEGANDASCGKGTFCVVEDRAQAIRAAIAMAEPQDSILIAGKGHEDYQIIGTEKIHFDDREVARDALRDLK